LEVLPQRQKDVEQGVPRFLRQGVCQRMTLPPNLARMRFAKGEALPALAREMPALLWQGAGLQWTHPRHATPPKRGCSREEEAAQILRHGLTA
jgi:hypothetical protein